MEQIDMTQLEIQVGNVKAYYIYFTCANCGNHFSIPVVERIQMDIVGAWKFKCLDCGNTTDWIFGHIRGIDEV